MDDVAIYDKIYSDCDFWKRVAVRAIKLSLVILNEATTIPNHLNRMAWAKAVRLDPLGKTKEMRVHILQNAAIFALDNVDKATNQQIEDAISANIDTFAK